MTKAFTLIELITAVLLGSIIMLMIAGGLQSSMKAWEAVQVNVAQNYNRRSVLDLIKRQTSSLFFKKNATEISTGGTVSGGSGGNKNAASAQNLSSADRKARGGSPGKATASFQLPEDATFFAGSIQELSFLSTVSFLSDFPGQVFAKYYVVQGVPEEGQSWDSLPSSRTEISNDIELDPGSEPEIPEELVGNLYLVLEEKNLFLSQLQEGMDEGLDGESGELDPQPSGFRSDEDEDLDGESFGDIQPVSSMELLGPLRKFSIRYRVPGQHKADEEDEVEDWAEVWDLEEDGFYPSAIEFVLFYEAEDGSTDLLPTDELEGIRMVIPIYDANNLARGTGGGVRSGRF